MCLFFLLFLIFWLKANSATSAQLLNKFVPKNNRPMVTVRVHTIPTTNMDVYKMTYNSYIICWQTSWLLTYKLIVVPALTGGMVIHLIANKIKGWLHRPLSLSLSLYHVKMGSLGKWVCVFTSLCFLVFLGFCHHTFTLMVAGWVSFVKFLVILWGKIFTSGDQASANFQPCKPRLILLRKSCCEYKLISFYL